MSTETVARDTLEQAAQEGLRVALLPQSYDIDYGADLKRLIDELAALPQSIAAHTRRYLNTTQHGIVL